MKTATNIILWILQVLLAGLFVFSGVMKLFVPLPADVPMPFPMWFIYFIGVCELLGGLGLVLPGLFRVQQHLTYWAALGLTIIMVGAVGTTLYLGMGGGALFPAVVGVLCALVAYGRK